MGRDARPKGIHWDPDHPNDSRVPDNDDEKRGEGFARQSSQGRRAVMHAPDFDVRPTGV